jgi:peroxiredoxin
MMWAGTVAVGVAAAFASPALGGSPSRGVGGALAPAQLASLDLRPYPSATPAPEFSLHTLDGRTISLAGMRGQVVLVNFWASWCRECRLEMPTLEALHQRFAARGLTVLGVNTREGPPVVRTYLRELGLTFPLLLDPDGAVTRRYGVIGLPATFLIGRDGRAVALAVGARAWASPAAVEIVETLLAVSGEPVP